MRKLRFKNLNEVLEELEKIRNAKTLKFSGQWTAPEIFKHCRLFMEYSMSRFPDSSSNFIRGNIGPTLFRNIKQNGYIPAGFKIRKNGFPENPGSFDEEFGALKGIIVRFQNYSGKHPEHPLFGVLTREDWELFHSYHLANHLSHISPVKKAAAKKKASKKSVKTAKKGTKKKTVKKTAKKSVKKSAKKKKRA